MSGGPGPGSPCAAGACWAGREAVDPRDHTATSPLSPCPGWSEAWGQRAWTGHITLPTWLDRGLRLSICPASDPPLSAGAAGFVLRPPGIHTVHAPGPQPRCETLPHAAVPPAYWASHRGGGACPSPGGFLSPRRPLRQPGQPPSGPSRTGLRPDGDPRGHGSRLTGRGRLGTLGRQQRWASRRPEPPARPQARSSRACRGSLPLPGPLPSPSKPSGGPAQTPGRGGSAGGDTDTCWRGPLAPDATPSSCSASGSADRGARLCSRAEGRGRRAGGVPAPDSQPALPWGPSTASVCASHTRGHRRACQRGGATHPLRRSGGPREHPGHCRGNRRDCQCVCGRQGPREA